MNLKRLCLLFAAILLLSASISSAASFEVRPGVQISFNELPAPWQISQQAPDFLVRERATGLHPPQLEAARKAGLDTPEAAARQMLKSSELFLFNVANGSYLEIDFSPLKQNEKAPSSRSLKASAKYTSEEFEHEEGIESASGSYRKTSLAGAASAYRADANFRKRGKDFRFVGVISYAQNHWIYLYYTGPQAAADDLTVAESVLKSFNISATQ